MYSFSERHVRLMEAIFAELRRRERIEGYWNAVRKIAVIIIAVLALAFVSVKFVPEVYAYVKEWLMEFADESLQPKPASFSAKSPSLNIFFTPVCASSKLP